MSRFQITEKGLEGFVKVLRLYPWTLLLEYQIEESPDEIVLTRAVLRHPGSAPHGAGLPEYECKEMHRREFVGIAAQVDPRIQVHCDFAPPGERPAGCDCRWRFTLRPAV